MLKSKILSVILLSICSSLYSQSNKLLTYLTSEKRYIKSLKIGEEIDSLSYCKHSWLSFGEDGNYIMMMRNKEKRGQWKLSDDAMLKFINKDVIDYFKIQKLNNKELLFSTIENNIFYTMHLYR